MTVFCGINAGLSFIGVHLWIRELMSYFNILNYKCLKYCRRSRCNVPTVGSGLNICSCEVLPIAHTLVMHVHIKG